MASPLATPLGVPFGLPKNTGDIILDDFSTDAGGQPPTGWMLAGGLLTGVKVENRMLHFDDSGNADTVIYYPVTWRDYQVETLVRVTSTASPSQQSDYAGPMVRVGGGGAGYCLLTYWASLTAQSSYLYKFTVPGAGTSLWSGAEAPTSLGTWVHAILRCVGSTISGSLSWGTNTVLQFSVNETSYATGSPGVAFAGTSSSGGVGDYMWFKATRL